MKQHDGYRILDLETYYRKDIYRRFTQVARSSVSITHRIDVTDLVAHSRRSGTKFYINFLYLLAKVLNSREDYRMGYLWQTDQVVIYDRINPCQYVFHEDTETCTPVYTEYNPDNADMQKEAANWTYLTKKVTSKQDLVDIKSNVKNSQFAQPLFEFSGACSGCGETPYVKLISQLFGDREIIANATGCSSIYSASIPSTPYTTNAKGQGPAFDNSLFEDFCEFGLGMVLGNKKMKERVVQLLNKMIESDKASEEYKEAAREWIAGKDDAEASKAAAAKLKPLTPSPSAVCASTGSTP